MIAMRAAPRLRGAVRLNREGGPSVECRLRLSPASPFQDRSMKDYLDLLRRIRKEGAWQDNRTGIRTQAISGACLSFDLRAGFPAVTTRRLAFKTFMGEMCGFLRGADSAAEFRALNCPIWDANANLNQAW